ncbi:hypothetical protein [Clostridium sp. C105KSO13]|uniref:hypothetical protein n=1 Tax=Clostridium sp. C105KSO13 TaxID=1776045 RepID=UPI0007407D43|nr:hypothetical protein [Clostridium sp. C105KSO13]CUX33585.1 hypothetical protein BN3456_01496 [Clostridium sp. C105KSO13]
MANYTSNTYTLKRKILTFTNKISRHLDKGVPAKAAVSYLHAIKKWVPAGLISVPLFTILSFHFFQK